MVALAVSLPARAASPAESQPQAAGTHAAEPASEGGDKDVSPAARLRFERGAEAFRAGRYREAADQFRQADRLEPSPKLSYNAAKAYDLMGDHKNALAAYREYLRRLPDAQNLQQTRGRIHELEGILRTEGVQQVTVLSKPLGATLLIDGEPRGVTPWTGELEPGTHHIHLRLRGHQDSEADFELDAARARDVTLPLQGVPSSNTAVAKSGEGDANRGEGNRVGSEAPAEALSSPPVGPDMAMAGGSPRWWTWAAFGGAAAALAGSGFMELARRSAEEDARSSDVQLDHEQSFRNMESRQGWARALVGAGLALGAAGGVSLYFDLQSRSSDGEWAALSCAGPSCTVSMRGCW